MVPEISTGHPVRRGYKRWWWGNSQKQEDCLLCQSKRTYSFHIHVNLLVCSVYTHGSIILPGQSCQQMTATAHWKLHKENFSPSSKHISPYFMSQSWRRLLKMNTTNMSSPWSSRSLHYRNWPFKLRLPRKNSRKKLIKPSKKLRIITRKEQSNRRPA